MSIDHARAMLMISAVRTLHASDGGRECGARATKTVTHSFSGRTDETRLLCTREPGHKGHHRDGLCCYTRHEFSDYDVNGFAPRDLRRCTSCGQRWPCATIKAMEEA